MSTRRTRRITSALLALGVLAFAPARAENWPSFRGPQASGVSAAPGPTTWDAEKSVNVAWKTKIPGLANSSPVVWGDRVFVTSAVSKEDDPTYRMGLYGDVDSVETKTEQAWTVYGLDKKSGKILWEKTVHTGIPKVKRHLKATHANSTPATDGKHLIALFGSEGLYCFDMDGNLKWKKDLGVLDAGWFYDPSYQWEYGASPILYKNLVIVQADIQKGSFLAAFDVKDGREVWRTQRDEIPSWASPVVFEAGGRAELVTNATKGIRAYDPMTGKELWKLAPNSEIVTPTPIMAHGLIYVTAGYRPINPVYAIRPGGSGDISLEKDKTSNDHIAWSKPRGGPYMATPIVVGDHLYTIHTNGQITVYNAKTGEDVYKERVAGPRTVSVTASPVAAGDKIYFPTEDGDVFVVKAGPKYELLATNPMGEPMMASPAITDGMLFIRGRSHLFAIQEKPGEKKAAGK
jgi:outer membrane protein assembly factor BamB